MVLCALSYTYIDFLSLFFLFFFFLNIFNARVFWLCVVHESFLVYRVVLQSALSCKTWFESCDEFHGGARRQTYTSHNGSCHYYLFHATKNMIDFIRMSMWRHNFWKEDLMLKTNSTVNN